jgi:phosphonate transport system ATP-binding protein
MTKLLQLEDVQVIHATARTAILRSVSLHVDAGERIAVLGRSGAGKTTLFRAINGFIPIASGRIRFDGREVGGSRGRALRLLRRDIGFIAQKHDLVDTLRVHQNVMAGALGYWSAWRTLRYLVRPKAAELAQARKVLSAVGIAEKLRAPTSALSGGQQQRVAIARALVQSPKLLLADEPVASLDPDTAQEILDLLCGLAEERGTALICTLHQPELAAHYFHRVVEIRDGAATECTPPQSSGKIPFRAATPRALAGVGTCRCNRLEA